MLDCTDKYHLKIDVKYVMISAIVGIMNAVTCHSRSGSFVMVIFEIIILSYFLVTKNIFKYTCFYTIFLTMSLEFGAYYGDEVIYGFRETRIMGVGIGTIAIIPIVIFGLLKNKTNIIHNKFDDSLMVKFLKRSYWIFLIAFLIGIFNLFIGDNGVNNLANPHMTFLKELYNYIILFIFPLIAFSFFIIHYRKRIEEIKSMLFAILYGLVISQIFSFLTPYKGITWDSTTLLVSFVMFYVPLLLCFSFYLNGKLKIIIFLIGLIGTVFSTVYTITSGGLLVVFTVPFLIILLLKKRKDYVSLIFCLMTIFFIAIFSICMINILQINASILLEYKFSQVLALLKFWDSNWYVNLPTSVKFRFQELSNILQEYIRKPYYLLFGKGVMGTCLDYNNTFMATHYVGEAGFSKDEWNIQAFFSMHESINVLFLSSGLFGLNYLFWTVKNSIKNLDKSPFLVVGIIYILFHYTYSFTASNFGIVCLLVGLYEVDKRRMKKICQ